MPKPIFDPIKYARDIRLKLADRNLDKKDAAKEIGVSASTITRVTNGARPDVESYLRINKWLAK